ncbi:MAG: Hsp20/alpha crystallin family protein, partial [Leptolyngbyaceae bacterium]|nr:Hsp20/alpha crystallin family protein [Leptolyngbyaceae bacterium]
MVRIQRLDPFREIDTLQRQMNHLLEDFIAPATVRLQNEVGFVPAAELTETEEVFVLKLELPGITPEDVSIEVMADSVAVSGTRKSNATATEQGGVRSEFRYGHFERVISLSSLVQNTKAEAEYKDGILHLTLPKVEEEKHRVV